MQVARVIGDIVATRKDPALAGLTLLLLQPVDTARQPVGRALIAADAVGAGTGELVFFVRGREAAFPFYPTEAPVDAAVVGIVDPVEAGLPPSPGASARPRRSSPTNLEERSRGGGG